MEEIEQQYRVSRQNFNLKNSIKLIGAILPETFEEKLLAFIIKSEQGLHQDCLIDLTRVTFIEIATLFNILSFVYQRSIQENKFHTYIAYPHNSNVIGFLNLWRFSSVLQKCIGIPFDKIILFEDLNKINNKPDNYPGRGGAVECLEFDRGWSENTGTIRNFFEFMNYKLDNLGDGNISAHDAATPQNESHRWQQPLIQSVLKKHFQESKAGSDISRIIIYEAISNAVRHPDATQVTVASTFNHNKEKVGKGHFKICIWDDGEGIALTLGKPLKAGKSIRSIRFPEEWYDKVHIEIEYLDYDLGNNKVINTIKELKSRIKVFDPNEDLESTATEGHILLASLFPGFSRTASERVSEVDALDSEDLIENGDQLTSALRKVSGMGLFSLMRIVIDQFQGKLIMRSGRTLLKIETAKVGQRKEYSTHYQCKLKKMPDYIDPFKGNLLICQLPIK